MEDNMIGEKANDKIFQMTSKSELSIPMLHDLVFSRIITTNKMTLSFFELLCTASIRQIVDNGHI